jgi:AraC-like DNA-binding protein
MRARRSHLHSSPEGETATRVASCPPSSVMLDRLLDSMDVAVESVTARVASPPATDRPDAGVLALACGSRVYFTDRNVGIVPLCQRPAPPSANGREADVTAPVVEAGIRIRVTYQGGVSLFEHLSEPVVVALETVHPLRPCIRELVDELSTARPGRLAMIATLLRRLLVLVLRSNAGPSGLLTWMAALEDPRLGRAVDAMKGSPEHAFTLPELAEVAGMSRSVFAARFADVLAQPPIEYLKTLRLSRAATLLRRTDLPIKAVASRVGYSSRSSFTRAFIACHGVAPHEFRAAATASGTAAPSTSIAGPLRA